MSIAALAVACVPIGAQAQQPTKTTRPPSKRVYVAKIDPVAVPEAR